MHAGRSCLLYVPYLHPNPAAVAAREKLRREKKHAANRTVEMGYMGFMYPVKRNETKMGSQPFFFSLFLFITHIDIPRSSKLRNFFTAQEKKPFHTPACMHVISSCEKMRGVFFPRAHYVN